MPDKNVPQKHSSDATVARMRADAQKIFKAGLTAADPSAAIARTCRIDDDRLIIGNQRFDLKTVQRMIVVGAGKATAVMAKAIEAILSDRIDDGIISVKYGHTEVLQHIDTIEANHPVPDQNGVDASRRILALALEAQKQDLVICLLSGGGSALLALPAGDLTLADKQETTNLLLACGATIHEINAVRKHLSAIKGGRLAQAAAPARIVTLILSDVVGDDLDVIASGPTVPDQSTFADCMAVIERYDLFSKLPRRVHDHMACGLSGKIEESPKSDSHQWTHTANVIVGSNRLALEACSHQAENQGYTPVLLSCLLEGEARNIAQMHAAIAKEILASGRPVCAPACLLSGGETTVTLKGNGRGGRNQEFALATALAIDGSPYIVSLNAGTDGTDGPTDAAGAVADHTTAARSRTAGLDIRRHLSNNDAYPFFKKLGDLVMTGPTGTNVMDLNIILIRKE